MTTQNRYVLGCFDTVDEVVDIIKDLKEKNFSDEDITLVTREDYVPTYSEKTDVAFRTEEQVLADPEPRTEENESLWDKVTNAFSIESHTARRPDPDYRTDDDPLYAYQDHLNRGCIVVMVNGAKWNPGQKEERNSASENEAETIVDMTDAMRSNVITSTGKEEILDSNIELDSIDEGNLHDNESHTD